MEDESIQTDAMSFVNQEQGFGVTGFDRLKSFETKLSQRDSGGRLQIELDALVERSGIAGRVIEYLPQAMGQKLPVYEIKSDEDYSGLAHYVQEKLDAIIPRYVEAFILARQCGGAGLFINFLEVGSSAPSKTEKSTNSAITRLATPVDLDRVIGIESIALLQGGRNGGGGEAQLRVEELETNIFSDRHGEPLFYSTVDIPKIHWSRIIPFYSPIRPITVQQKKLFKGWGLPMMHRVFEPIRNLMIGEEALAQTMSRFSLLIYKMRNYAKAMESETGRDLIEKRSRRFAQDSSVLNLVVLDAGQEGIADELKYLEIEYAGIVAAIEECKDYIAAECDGIPKAILFNTQQKAIGSGGDKSGSRSVAMPDEKAWSDHVNRCQKDYWMSSLLWLCDIWAKTNDIGFSKEAPVGRSITFPAIVQLSEHELADLRYKDAQTDQIYLQNRVATPKDVANRLSHNTSLGSVLDITKVPSEYATGLTSGAGQNPSPIPNP